MSTSLPLPVVLSPGNRLDLESADAFRRDVDACLATATTDVVVDLARTEHMDVAGFAALANLLVRCRASGRSVTLTGPMSPTVARLVDFSGFARFFGRRNS